MPTKQQLMRKLTVFAIGAPTFLSFTMHEYLISFVVLIGMLLFIYEFHFHSTLFANQLIDNLKTDDNNKDIKELKSKSSKSKSKSVRSRKRKGSMGSMGSMGSSSGKKIVKKTKTKTKTNSFEFRLKGHNKHLYLMLSLVTLNTVINYFFASLATYDATFFVIFSISMLFAIREYSKDYKEYSYSERVQTIFYLAIDLVAILLTWCWNHNILIIRCWGDIGLKMYRLLWIDVFLIDAFGFLFGNIRKKPSVVNKNISPHKSWEGYTGMLFAGFLVNRLFYLISHTGIGGIFLPDMSRNSWDLMFLFLYPCCVFGDLSESLWKRLIGIKDSGTFFKSHGGFFDKADSIIPGVVSLYLFMMFYSPFGEMELTC